MLNFPTNYRIWIFWSELGVSCCGVLWSSPSHLILFIIQNFRLKVVKCELRPVNIRRYTLFKILVQGLIEFFLKLWIFTELKGGCAGFTLKKIYFWGTSLESRFHWFNRLLLFNVRFIANWTYMKIEIWLIFEFLDYFSRVDLHWFKITASLRWLRLCKIPRFIFINLYYFLSGCTTKCKKRAAATTHWCLFRLLSLKLSHLIRL